MSEIKTTHSTKLSLNYTVSLLERSHSLIFDEINMDILEKC